MSFGTEPIEIIYLEMIKNAGVGVAMYNADRVVKSIAKCVTDSNKNKGVEMWLRKNLTF